MSSPPEGKVETKAGHPPAGTDSFRFLGGAGRVGPGYRVGVRAPWCACAGAPACEGRPEPATGCTLRARAASTRSTRPRLGAARGGGGQSRGRSERSFAGYLFTANVQMQEKKKLKGSVFHMMIALYTKEPKKRKSFLSAVSQYDFFHHLFPVQLLFKSP